MEFDGFQKDNVHWKALKMDFFDAVVVFPTTKIAQKNTKGSQKHPKIKPSLFETLSISNQYGFTRVDKKKMIKIRTQKKSGA